MATITLEGGIQVVRTVQTAEELLHACSVCFKYHKLPIIEVEYEYGWSDPVQIEKTYINVKKIIKID